MKILVTGSACFIVSALTLRLLERGDEVVVVGIDSHNAYYDPALKEARFSAPHHTNAKAATYKRI
jgi:UDP-glucuronate 4-epimerase